jgi:K+-sensing histidine kinase KdpD
MITPRFNPRLLSMQLQSPAERFPVSLPLVAISPALLRYSSAVMLVAIVTGIRLLLDPLLGNRIPFLPYFLCIALAARYTGFGPSVLALLLGGILASYFFLTPLQHFGDLFGLGLYVIVGMVIILLTESQRRAELAARRKQEELEAEVRRHLQTADMLRQTQKDLDGRIVELQAAVTQHVVTAEQLSRERSRLMSAEQSLQKTQSELQARVHDLEEFEQAVVGRELKMIELEKEIQRLRSVMRPT